MDAPDEYRGIEVPKLLKRFFYNMSGRWWRKGIDAVLDSDEYKELVEKAFYYDGLSK